MDNIAVVPSLALLAGASWGLAASDVHPQLCGTFLAVALLIALAGWYRSFTFVLAAAVAVGFFTGGALLADRAWQQAWRPSLKAAFEALAQDERSSAERAGRRLPAETPVSAEITGIVREDASPTPTGASLSLGVLEIDIPPRRVVTGGVLLTVVGDLARSRAGAWTAGRVVRATAELRRPSRYLDPGVPDEERILARRGTTLVGTVKSGSLVEIVSRGSLVAESAAAIRAFVRRAVTTAVGRWSQESAGIVTAIVIGDRAGLSEEVQKRLQEAGTYHVIAISGGNIAILVTLTLGTFRITGLLRRSHRAAQAGFLCAIAALLAYGYLVGGGASVDRATLMAAIYLGARAADLRGPPLNSLVFVAALLVAADPLSVVDPAFLLTFGATAAILVAVPAVPLERIPRILAPVGAMTVASAATEAALLPIAAFIFARVTFAGLVLNFAAIPLMAVAQIAGMALVPVAIVSSRIASAIGWIAYLGARGLVVSAGFVRFVPSVTWRVAPPSWPVMALYYTGLGAAFALRSDRSRILRLLRAVAIASICAASIWILAEPWRLAVRGGDGRLHATFIDVGQGDAALITFPRGATLLVDAGGLAGSSAFDMGDRVVAPVLREAGIRRLESLVLTHGDGDHIGGAASVIREFAPSDVWEGIPVPSSGPLGALKRVAFDTRSRWTNVQRSDTTMIDGVRVEVKSPAIGDWERRKVRNDDSIVLELSWGEASLVLAGDIERETEEAVAPLFSPSPLRILKVPHHGSSTSSTEPFVRALSPRLAVVSVGRSNSFGHPSADVLDRYRRLGAEVFRTDQDGAVMLDTDGHSVNVRTFTGRTLTVHP